MWGYNLIWVLAVKISHSFAYITFSVTISNVLFWSFWKTLRSPEFRLLLQTVPAKKAVNVQAADYTYASSFNVSNFYTVYVKMGRMNGKKNSRAAEWESRLSEILNSDH